MCVCILQDKDGKISLEDFLQGAKADSTIVKALTIYDGLLWITENIKFNIILSSKTNITQHIILIKL